MHLTNKRILLGVTGSIAAYKAAELIRRLRDAGAEVRVVMTQGAEAFITPLTLQALSGKPVHQHLLDTEAEAGMGHIELARWADVILVAPSSADFIARLAAGRADDLLSAVCLASEAPLALAPAMNVNMWQNPATQENIQLVQQRGVLLFGPDAGGQACGDVGEGRMREVEGLLDNVAAMFQTGALAGKLVLITAGPTREAIDPVRYLSNHSSGKMGYAIADAAVEAGARVILVSGPTALTPPEWVETLFVESAEQMLEAVQANMAGVDIFIATAAVADYRPVSVAKEKLKKDAAQKTLQLERTPDILAHTTSAFPKAFSVGFAAETTRLEQYARAKLEQKSLDMIAANLVGPAATDTDGAFGSETNALRLFWPGGECVLPKASKAKLARTLVGHIAERFAATGRDKPAAQVVPLKTTGKPASK